MKPFTFAIIAGLISAPAFAAESEPAAPSAAPVSAEPTPAVAEPTPPPAAAEPAHASHAPAAQDRVAAPPAERQKPKETARGAAAGPKDKDKDGKKLDAARKPALTKQAYARLLAAEIKRRTPKSSNDKTGSIHVAFTIGASGRVVSHKVRNSSNPALEPIVGQILASVHTPPPPGGSFAAIQEFNFH